MVFAPRQFRGPSKQPRETSQELAENDLGLAGTSSRPLHIRKQALNFLASNERDYFCRRLNFHHPCKFLGNSRARVNCRCLAQHSRNFISHPTRCKSRRQKRTPAIHRPKPKFHADRREQRSARDPDGAGFVELEDSGFARREGRLGVGDFFAAPLDAPAFKEATGIGTRA